MPHTIQVDLNQLLFDPENPRLPDDAGPGQAEIFRYLVTEIGVEDLLSAVSSGGVIEADPIIVRDSESRGKYYVVEGNRRLAAFKLLAGHRIDDGGTQPSVPAAQVPLNAAFSALTVQKDWDPEQLEAYLGYKHVTSTREWGPEAKARFVLRGAKGDLRDENLRSFARQFGTTLTVLKRWLVALLVRNQAEARGLFDPGSAYKKRYFGTLYTLLGSAEVRRHLGLSTETLSDSMVPEGKESTLAEFLVWVAGHKEQRDVVNSRDQRKLEMVLSSETALEQFRRKNDLDLALVYTDFKESQIASELRAAAYAVESCLPKLNDVREHKSVADAYASLKSAFLKAKLNMEDPA